jgi:hypothetical protein
VSRQASIPRTLKNVHLDHFDLLDVDVRLPGGVAFNDLFGAVIADEASSPPQASVINA